MLPRIFYISPERQLEGEASELVMAVGFEKKEKKKERENMGNLQLIYYIAKIINYKILTC